MNAVSMGDIWGWVWQAMLVNSISTVVLVPVVLLLCRIFDRRPAIQNLLWLLLLVKFMTPQLPGFAWVIPQSIAGSGWNQTSPTQLHQPKHVEQAEEAAEADWGSPEHDAASSHLTTTTDAMNNEEEIRDIQADSQPTITISPWSLGAATLGGIWILGTGSFLVSMCYGLGNQRRILKRATVASQKLMNSVTEVANRLGLRKLVPIQSSDIQSPFISCLGSVRLVWPTCLTSSDPASHRSLIAHEVAHVRRRDHFVAWLELIATLVWWWNPVFWFVRRRLRTSAEMACDAMALEAFPEDRCLYAEKLLELSTCFKNGAQPLALAVSSDAPSSIEKRLTMIVSEQGSSKTTLLGLLIVTVLAIGAIPSWSFAQSTDNPPATEPISWLLDPFMGRGAPPSPTTAGQQEALPALVLDNREKLVLRLKAMYLVAISENRTTDAEALAAAIAAMTQVHATAGNAKTGDLLGAPGAAPAESGMGSAASGTMGSIGPGETASPSNTVPGGAPAGILDQTGGMLGGRTGDGIEYWSTVYKRANSNFDVPNRIYPKEVIPDHLALRIKVTGTHNGMVWGSNPYTDDSSLNAAAIHSGLVNAGQTAEVVFIRRPGKESYSGSESHGVTTLEYGPFPSSFELAPVSQHADASYLCDRSALRGNTDAYLSLNMLAGQAPLKPGVSLIVPLHGNDGGPVVGTDQYASDCNLDAAAVHAGVLKLGESAIVKIILAEGLENYAGSKRNGVESLPYGKTKMSLRFEMVLTTSSGNPLTSPISSGGAIGRTGEAGSLSDSLQREYPPGAIPNGIGAPSKSQDSDAGISGSGAPPDRVGQEFTLDRRAYLSRDLGPRRNWQIERLNLPSTDSLGQLRPFQDLALRIKVVGKYDGAVWGSNAYTDDSSLNSAALHSGLIKVEETAEVVAIIRPGMKSYAGSESHGITSLDFGPYPGSFQLVPVAQHPDAPYLCDRRALRGNNDAYLSLNMLSGQASLKPGISLIVPLLGKAGSPVVGTDQYASDCNLDAAAVHAGVLKEGESGYVKIVLAEGLERYSASNRNGVESHPYGETKMSIRFEKLQAQPMTPNSATSLNDQTLRAIVLITDGLGTVSLDEERIRAIQATSESKTTEPSADSPGVPNAPTTSDQQLLPNDIPPLPSGNVSPSNAPPNNPQSQSSPTRAPTDQQRILQVRVSSNKEGEISSIAIGSEIWTSIGDGKKDLKRRMSFLSDNLETVSCDQIEIHLEDNVIYDRAREIIDACTRLRTADGQPINTVIVSDRSDADDHKPSMTESKNDPQPLSPK